MASPMQCINKPKLSGTPIVPSYYNFNLTVIHFMMDLKEHMKGRVSPSYLSLVDHLGSVS